MAKLDADMQSLVRRTILCFAATINGDGSPNLSPKSTLIVHDDDHLLFANIASPRTVANLRLDPRIEINCVDIFSRRGYRFTGHASVRSAGDPIYNEFAAALRTELPHPRCRACQGAFCQTNSFTRLRLCRGRDGN